jgi:hypothetical protein
MALGELALAARDAAGTDCDSDAVSQASKQWCAKLGSLIRRRHIADDQRALLLQLKARAQRATADDPFHLLFNEVTLCSAQAYGAAWAPPRLALGWTRSHPRPGAADPYGVTAKTRLEAVPAVDIQVYRDGFNPAAYAVLPLLMVHECVCHVPARQGGKAANESPFAEGFMDWAARFFFDLWMPKVDAALTPAALRHALRVDDVLTDPGTPVGAARLRGRSAADRLVVWLQKDQGRPHSEARAWLARLAVQLNCADAPLEVKDRFVVYLNAPTWSSRFVHGLSAVVDGAPARSLL